MSEYFPDCWVILEFDTLRDGVYRKVLAGWYGGYLGSNSWKLSSAITKLDVQPDGFITEGMSGSKYYLGINSMRLSGLMHSVLTNLQNAGGGFVRQVPLEEISRVEGADNPSGS